jgi:hypothetical protein
LIREADTVLEDRPAPEPTKLQQVAYLDWYLNLLIGSKQTSEVIPGCTTSSENFNQDQDEWLTRI